MNKQISNERIKEIITGIESQCPVDEWSVNGIFVWPYIRNKIYIFLLNYTGEKNSLSEKVPNPSKSEPKRTKNIYKFSGVYKTICLTKAAISLTRFYKSLRPKKIIFFGSSFHRVLYHGVSFNRFFDSMVEFHNLHDKVYVVESQEVNEQIFNKKAIIPLKKNLDNFKLLLRFNSLFSHNKRELNLRGYEEFYQDFCKTFLGTEALNISKIRIISWGIKIFSVKQFYLKLYKKVKPEKAIFLSYNGYDDLYAAILAANELKIKTIDFQHGFQTNLHMVYSHWTKIPTESYNIMPMEYWTWDEFSQDNINKWAGSTKDVSAKVVGHPYLSLCLKEAKKNNKSDKIIFYSLGVEGLEEMFPIELLKVIKSTTYNWVLRLHPRSRLSFSQIASLMNTHNINEKKFHIENAFDFPLPNTLANSILHITNYSGCLLEARMMGIPSLIISKAGMDYYKDYIDNDLVYYVNKNDKEFEEKFENVFVEVSSKKHIPKVGEIINPLLV